MSDSPRILVADDEQDCIDFVAETLADTDCEVISVNDGNRALETARSQQVDLIILDVQMPGYNGFEVFSKLRADRQFDNTPIVMLTGINDRTDFRKKFDAKDMGEYTGSEPEAFIDKPIEPILLKQTVLKLLKDRKAN
jgi:CheY-like chemotaxis protein